jgi:hypothetical protein
VAFDRLRFRALNRYLLKNSSSIETEIRSLIVPLIRINIAGIGYLSLYVQLDSSVHQLPTMERYSDL